jgi:alpha/beta superfamily hydrolase
VIPQHSAEKLAQKLQKQKNITIDYRTIEASDHFFSNHLDTLSSHIEQYLEKSFPKVTQ